MPAERAAAPAAATTIRAPRGAAAEALVPALANLLIACVDAGASVGFLAPLAADKARAYWQGGVLAAVDAGATVLLVAEAPGGRLVGTVQLVLARFENQPHRADVAKLLVHPRARRRGIGAALMHAAEAAARAEGRTLLVLDTAGDEAERLYRRGGWTRVGKIPGYALWPDGTPGATTFYYKDLAARQERAG